MIVGVTLAQTNRFRFSKGPAAAQSNTKKGVITFNPKWFDRISPQARCSALVHELWHFRTMDKRRQNERRLFRDGVLYAVVSLFTIAFEIGIMLLLRLDPIAIFGVYFFSAAFLADHFERKLISKYRWSIEYECDEAGVRFIGAEPTKEVLRTFRRRFRGRWSTHPSPKGRIKRTDEIAHKYMTPEIDYRELEREIPFEVIPIAKRITGIVDIIRSRFRSIRRT